MLLGVSKYGIKLAINVMLELAPLGEAGQAVSAWITCRGRTRVRLVELYMYAYIYFYQSGAAWSIGGIGSGILDLHQATHIYDMCGGMISYMHVMLYIHVMIPAYGFIY